jgi:hypothetical protein
LELPSALGSSYGDMRPTNIFNKSRRKKRGTGNNNAYRRQAAANYEQELERVLLGSSGACVYRKPKSERNGDEVRQGSHMA